MKGGKEMCYVFRVS